MTERTFIALLICIFLAAIVGLVLGPCIHGGHGQGTVPVFPGPEYFEVADEYGH